MPDPVHKELWCCLGTWTGNEPKQRAGWVGKEKKQDGRAVRLPSSSSSGRWNAKEGSKSYSTKARLWGHPSYVFVPERGGCSLQLGSLCLDLRLPGPSTLREVVGCLSFQKANHARTQPQRRRRQARQLAHGVWAQGANGQHAGVIAYQERPQDRAKTQALYAGGNGHTVQQLKFHYDTAAHAVELK